MSSDKVTLEMASSAIYTLAEKILSVRNADGGGDITLEIYVEKDEDYPYVVLYVDDSIPITYLGGLDLRCSVKIMNTSPEEKTEFRAYITPGQEDV